MGEHAAAGAFGNNWQMDLRIDVFTDEGVSEDISVIGHRGVCL